MLGWLAETLDLRHTIGVAGAMELVLARRRQWRGATGAIRLRIPRSTHTLELRLGGSDLATFEQVFVDGTYAPLLAVPDVTTILDLGANVGCTSAQLLTAHERARLVAVEPDPDNATLLARNLAPWGGRAEVLRGAVWSHETGLVLDERPYRDGGAWARQVRATREGERPAMQAWGVDQLMDRLAPGGIVDLVKMDVEGAEVVLLEAGRHEWLRRVRCLAIELHDDSSFGPATPRFAAALEGRRAHRQEIGDTTIVTFDDVTPRAA